MKRILILAALLAALAAPALAYPPSAGHCRIVRGPHGTLITCSASR